MRSIRKHIKYSVPFFVFLMIMLFQVITVYSRYITKLSADFNSEIIALGQVEIFIAETKVNNKGIPLTGDEAGITSKGQSYKLIPGCTYVKDPFITVLKGSNPCWLFIEVENGISKYEANTNTILDQIYNNGWVLIEEGKNIYYYHEPVDAFDEEKVIQIFEEFTIAPDANANDEWNTIFPDNTILSITPYAIQADGFNDDNKTTEENIISAWEALNEEFAKKIS